MKKKILCFDGDGTLWYPSTTKRTQKPHWIYHDSQTKDHYLNFLELVPQVKNMLTLFREKDMVLAVISASPYSTDIAQAELRKKLIHFDLLDLFHSYHSSDGNAPDDKGRVLLHIIDSIGCRRSDMLMIGDSYAYDHLAARKVGVDTVLIASEYIDMVEDPLNELIVVNETTDLLNIVET